MTRGAIWQSDDSITRLPDYQMPADTDLGGSVPWRCFRDRTSPITMSRGWAAVLLESATILRSTIGPYRVVSAAARSR